MPSRYEEIMKTKKFLPFGMGYLTDEMITKAKLELNETEDVRSRALVQMRKLVHEETNLKCRTEDAYLLQFLRARKFDVKKAFTLLQNKYQVKKSYPDVYDTCDIDDIRRILDAKGGPISFLPYRDEDGCAVLILQMCKWNPGDFSISTAFAAMSAVILYGIEDIATQVCGVRVIFDAKGASLRQVRCVTPRHLNLLSRALRNCLPVRFKGIHICNESMIIQYLWSILKLFLSEKIKNRIRFHGDNQKHLQKFIPKAILSGDYGGDNETFSNADWCKIEMEKFYEKFQLILSHGYQDE